MKRRLFVLLLSAMLALSAAAFCETDVQLPGVECFSPGLARLNAAGDLPVSMTAQMSVEDAVYARDLSVLGSMLDGTTLHYQGSGSLEAGMDAIRLERMGQTLFEAKVSHTQEGPLVALGSGVYAPGSPDTEAVQGRLWELFDGKPILERFALADVEGWLLSLKAGDEIIAGYAVVEPFTCEQTMSDDGSRLTKISISGSIAREGEAPWAVKGWLRQPAGRAPKDTFEITLTQDEKNFIELAYSCLRQHESTRKNKSGQAKVDTALKAAGKLGGYNISSRLTTFMRNAYEFNGENLSEKITLTTTLTHQDKTPGMRMHRLNDIEAKVKNVIRLTTAQGQEVFPLTDEMTVSVTLDGNAFAAGSAKIAMELGAQPAQSAAVQAENAVPGKEAFASACSQAAAELAARLYMQLDEKQKAPIHKGL